jgi:HAMP domain-containing protein
VRVVISIVAACTIAAAGLATLLALAIVEPLEDLAAAADEMQAGHFPDAVPAVSGDEVGRLASAFNAMVAGRRTADDAQKLLIAELHTALGNVRLLEGLLPICASCKRIRDDRGYWNQIESYISAHADVQFSHGLCPECLRSNYPELADRVAARLAASPPQTGGSGG